MISRPCQKLNLYFYQFLLQTVLLMTVKVNFLNSSCILIGQNFGNYIIDLEGFSNRYQIDYCNSLYSQSMRLNLRTSVKNAERKDPKYVLNEKQDLNFIKLVTYFDQIYQPENSVFKAGSNASSLIYSLIGKTSILHSSFVKPVIKRLYSIQKMEEAFITRFQIVLFRLFLDIQVYV